MSNWVIFLLIFVIVLGVVLSNIFLLRDSKKFTIPKGFKAKKFDDDEDNNW